MSEVPEELLRRIATAKARALGDTSDEIPTTSVGSGEPLELPEGVEPLAGGSSEIPGSLRDRVGAAHQAAIENLGPAPERNAVPKTDVPRVTPEPIAVAQASPSPAAAAPAAAPAAVEPAPAASEPAPAAAAATEPASAAPAAAAPVVSAGMSVEEAAKASGMPEKLLRRSVEAKAKALGVSFDQALAEMFGGSVAAAPAAAAPAAAPAAAEPVPAAAAATEPAPAVAAAAAPLSTTVVALPEAEPQEAAPTETRPPAVEEEGETINAWPALFRIELVTAALSAVILTLLSLAGPAPLLAQAGGTVDPSVAPWYLVWLEQLLAWLPLPIAGFFVPLLVIVGLFAVPFIDRNPEAAPSSRKLALVMFGIFSLTMLVLTVIGLAARASGFGWPWT